MNNKVFKALLFLLKGVGLGLFCFFLFLCMLLVLSITYTMFLVPNLLSTTLAHYSSLIAVPILASTYFIEKNKPKLLTLSGIFYLIFFYLGALIVAPASFHKMETFLMPVITVLSYFLTNLVIKSGALNKFKLFKIDPVSLLSLKTAALSIYTAFIIFLIGLPAFFDYDDLIPSRVFIIYITLTLGFIFILLKSFSSFIKKHGRALYNYEKVKFTLITIILIFCLFSLFPLASELYFHPDTYISYTYINFLDCAARIIYFLTPLFLMVSVVNDILGAKHKMHGQEILPVKTNKLRYLLVFSGILISLIPLYFVNKGITDIFFIKALLMFLPLVLTLFLLKFLNITNNEEPRSAKNLVKAALLTVLFAGSLVYWVAATGNIISSDAYIARIYYKEGVEYKLKGWPNKSKKLLKEAILLDPDGKAGEKARLYLERKLPKSDKITREAIIYNIRGANYEYDKKYEEAILEYNKAIEESPEFEWPYINLAVVYYKQYKNYDEAEKLIKQALALNPEYTNAIKRLADLYFCKGKEQSDLNNALELYLKAQGLFDKFLLLEPKDSAIDAYTKNQIKDLKKRIKELEK